MGVPSGAGVYVARAAAWGLGQRAALLHALRVEVGWAVAARSSAGLEGPAVLGKEVGEGVEEGVDRVGRLRSLGREAVEGWQAPG